MSALLENHTNDILVKKLFISNIGYSFIEPEMLTTLSSMVHLWLSKFFLCQSSVTYHEGPMGWVY